MEHVLYSKNCTNINQLIQTNVIRLLSHYINKAYYLFSIYSFMFLALCIWAFYGKL